MEQDSDLQALSREELIGKATDLRNAIREHRDSTGHDLCWHHPKLWALLPEKTKPRIAVPEWPEFMRRCVLYRQSLEKEAGNGSSGFLIGGSRYVLAVQDIKRSVDFYREKLGFQTYWEEGGWCFLYRDRFKLMLGECPDDMPAHETGCHSYFAYLETEQVDALFKEFRSRGAEILAEPEDKPWGQREFAVRTIDGHRMTFGQAL